MSMRCDAIILAGGLNTRMGGRNKAFLRLGNRSFLERIVDTLGCCTDTQILSTRQPEVYEKCDLDVVSDRFKLRSPLSGIHAGLVHMHAEYAFCTGCDAPLLKREVVQLLVDAIEPGDDVVVPVSGTYYQPLCAIYSKRCVPIIEEQLIKGDLKTDRLFERVVLHTIPYETFQTVDPHLMSFFNVNTLQDLDTATQMLHIDSSRRETE